MSKKIILLMLIISAFLISGCIDKDTKIPQTTNNEFIPQKNLPDGFSYMGTHDTSIHIGSLSLTAIEGIYRYDSQDIYVQAIKNNDPASLVRMYKDRYKDANYDPFEEVSFNGHKATQITDYVTIGGKQAPRYTVIWEAKEHLMIVGSFPDNKTVITLASATGY